MIQDKTYRLGFGKIPLRFILTGVVTSNNADVNGGNTYYVLETGRNGSDTDILVSVNELEAFNVLHDIVSNIANHDDTFIEDVSESVDQQQTENSVELNNVKFVSRAEDHWTDDNNTTNKITYNNTRLPQSIRPRLYNITLQPFIDSDDPEDFYFLSKFSLNLCLECIKSRHGILSTIHIIHIFV